MPVTFGSGDFSSTSPDQTTLSSFHLDRTVKLTTNVKIGSSDSGFYVGLVLRTPDGGSEGVKTSESFNPDPGTVVSVPFDSIPEGYYDIVIVSVGGTVSGSFTTTWEDEPDDGSDDELPPPVTTDQ